GAAMAQTTQELLDKAPQLEFEVASIKLVQVNSGGPMRIGLMNTPDGFTTENATLQMMITYAYAIQNYQIQGGPGFMTSDHYNIDAKMDEATADILKKMSTNEERNAARQKMVQGLLADRFHLTIHKESKEMPIYNLVVAKNGIKMTEAKPLPPLDPNAPKGDAPTAKGDGGGPGKFGPGPGRGGPSMFMSGGRGGAMTLTATSMPMLSLVRMLSGTLGRPVIDKTGLTATYDFKLEYTRDDLVAGPAPGGGGGGDGAPPVPAAESSGPTLFTAVQEQLGLKLESTKGPVQIIVIDRAEKPSDN
ncbi:MAG TPA: TIGR03435 family protein, partial [Candidatus Acidoferrales bacterium]|nr:TIGR03435 family protein [Candidatus Acidoferrales bacterium]